MIKVMLFAGLAEAVKQTSVELPFNEPVTVKTVKEELVKQFPDCGLEEKLKLSFAAVNHEYCPDDTHITSTDEVAFIPPVSGG